jgi:predicted alpha/beta-hydrolase family hydrolase
MKAWAQRLAALGEVKPFDYPYQLAGKKSPDRPPVLVSSHRAALAALEVEHAGPIVLIGKSMGGRIGCHVAVELATEGVGAAQRPAALVCLGYPLVAPGGAVRDEVLLALDTPVLFVQGTRDAMCPLERLASVRARMKAESELHVVEGGDHSLVASAGALRQQGVTQKDVDQAIVAAIEAFVTQPA